jgi:phosphatidylglycerol lysyltransferase
MHAIVDGTLCSEEPPDTAEAFGAPAERVAVEMARELVLAHGWNAVSYQILNPGFMYWFSARADAVVGYWRDPKSHVRVVAGAPICAAERLPDVVSEWERDATGSGDPVCYVFAADRLLALFQAPETAARFQPHAAIPVGAQPVWDPANWPGIVASKSSLRQQCRRARNKGVSVEEWTAERAAASAGLRRCLRDWISVRPLPPLHFLAEPHTLDRLAGRRVFVAVRSPRGERLPGGVAAASSDSNPDGGDVVGFLVASPVPCRNGWLFEQIIRRPGAPNGIAEALIDVAMRCVSADGAHFVTLGLSPLSHRGNPGLALFHVPFWLRFLLLWARAHGRRFWNFEGLDAFKAKFQPDEWEPIFAIAGHPEFTPGILFAAARAFSPADSARFSTLHAFRYVITDALKQEWRRVTGKAVADRRR